MAHLRGLSLQRWLLPPALVATAIALRPAPALACSYALRAIEVSYPEPDALDVPTNAVLFVYGHNLNSEGIRLLDASGADVPVQVQPVEPSGWDVLPLAPLEPGRAYQLHAAGVEYASSNVVPFTTSSGPAAVPERMETPELDVAVLLYPPGPCGEQQGVCLGTTAPPGTTLEVRIGEEVLMGLADYPSRWFGAYGTFFPESECLEVRARDVRGRRSPPRTVCGAEALRIEVPPGTTDNYTCENYSTVIQDADQESSSAPEPDLVENSDTAVTTSSAPEGDLLPLPRDVTYGASGPSDPAAADGCGCKLTSKNATRSSAGLLSIGWIALLSMRRRRARS